MQKIKKGHHVMILKGKDKHKTGKVLAVFPKRGQVIIEGINKVKKTEKKNPQTGHAGGIKEKEAPIAFSNIGIFNEKTQKADRVKIFLKDNHQKIRQFKSDHALIDIE